jgi:hypothetical protein
LGGSRDSGVARGDTRVDPFHSPESGKPFLRPLEENAGRERVGGGEGEGRGEGRGAERGKRRGEREERERERGRSGRRGKENCTSTQIS